MNLLERAGRLLGRTAFGRGFVEGMGRGFVERTLTRILEDSILPHQEITSAGVTSNRHTHETHDALVAISGACPFEGCPHPKTKHCVCWSAGTSLPGRCQRCGRMPNE